MGRNPNTRKRRNPNTSKSHWRAPDGNEYPIVDLEYGASILVPVIARDVRKAIPRDPNACAIAQAWKRVADVPVAQIGCDKAYLAIRRGGRMIALRCKVPKATREAVHRFDRTGKMPAEGFILTGIPPSERMDSQRNIQKRFRERWGTVHDPHAKRHTPLYLRNASRRAQVFRTARPSASTSKTRTKERAK